MTTSDLFATDRQEPLASGDEQDQLESWVEYHRETLLRKCEGLSSEQLRTPSCPPSNLTLLGLVRHMADVESWFNDDLSDGEVPPIYWSATNRDGDFEDAAEADLESDVATFRASLERSRAWARTHRDLDQVVARSRSGEDRPLRWVYLHMIEEYARHCGHADLLRERIDGATGD